MRSDIHSGWEQVCILGMRRGPSSLGTTQVLLGTHGLRCVRWILARTCSDLLSEYLFERTRTCLACTCSACSRSDLTGTFLLGPARVRSCSNPLGTFLLGLAGHILARTRRARFCSDPPGTFLLGPAGHVPARTRRARFCSNPCGHVPAQVAYLGRTWPCPAWSC